MVEKISWAKFESLGWNAMALFSSWGGVLAVSSGYGKQNSPLAF